MVNIVSDEYPWSKLFREYLMYCAVGCINVAIFFILYWAFVNYNTWTGYVETIAWAISFLLSSIQGFILHRWLTFESDSNMRSSFYRMMLVYGVLWLVSTITFKGKTVYGIVISSKKQFHYEELSILTQSKVTSMIYDGSKGTVRLIQRCKV